MDGAFGTAFGHFSRRKGSKTHIHFLALTALAAERMRRKLQNGLHFRAHNTMCTIRAGLNAAALPQPGGISCGLPATNSTKKEGTAESNNPD